MTLLLLLRWVTTFIAGATMGYAIVILVKYWRHHDPATRKVHVLLIGASYICWVMVSMAQTVDSILHLEPFHWWSSPLEVVGAMLGFAALTRYLPLDPKGGE